MRSDKPEMVVVLKCVKELTLMLFWRVCAVQ